MNPLLSFNSFNSWALTLLPYYFETNPRHYRISSELFQYDSLKDKDFKPHAIITIKNFFIIIP